MSKKIDDMTIGEAREIARLFDGGSDKGGCGCNSGVWEIGKNYLIRTVTMIDSGRLVGVSEHELVLEDVAWIADTGRFAQALITSEFSEVEPFPDGRVILGRGSIIDAVQIKSLPRKQK